MMHIPKTYGWVPDLPDQRDFLYQDVRRRKIRVPKTMDLRIHCSPVENQGALGSCTANALAGALEFVDLTADPGFTDVSRLFIYYNERVLIHTVDEDSGAMLRDGIKTLKKQGVCSEKTWPYRIKRFTQKPAPKCYVEAKAHCISSYRRILSHAESLSCLAEGFPFVFGFTVYESFESPIIARSGVVRMPAKLERVVGGHAVLAVGYDEKTKRFLVRNSWGTEWGMSGYFTMPYAYLDSLADDFWTVRK